MSAPNGLEAASGKPALDAMTDQSLAFARENRADADPDALRLSAEVAAQIAEQFPGQGHVTGRVLMCVAQMHHGLHDQGGPETEAEAAMLGQLADVFALAAEQVVREAGET